MAEKRQPINKDIDKASAQLLRKSTELNIELDKRLARGQDVETAVSGAWKAIGMDAEVSTTITTNIVNAVERTTVRVIRNKKDLGQWFLDKFVAEDGIKLSSRIVSGGRTSQKIIIGEIKSQLKVGASWTKLARAIDDKQLISGDIAGHIQDLVNKAKRAIPGDPATIKTYRTALAKSQREVARLARAGAPTTRLKKAYQAVIRATDKGDALGIQKAITRATRAKSNFNAQRIARTEISRAYKEAVNVEMASDKDIIGYNSAISSRHAETDICDVIAEADLYGMGPGNYPKNRGPGYPYHPHCADVLTPLFVGQQKRTFKPKSGETFLNNQSKKRRVQILGKEGEKAFQRKPDNWQKIIGFKQESKAPKIPERFFE